MNTRQFRILTILTVVAGFLGGGVAVLLLQGIQAHAQAGWVPQRLTAREFVLVDKAGNERMIITVNEHNVAGLHLFSVKGKQLLILAAGKDGAPGLDMNDSAGKPVLDMSVLPGGASLSMYDSARKLRLALAVYKGVMPDLTMWDSAGKERASMGVLKDDPYLRIVKSEEYIWGAP